MRLIADCRNRCMVGRLFLKSKQRRFSQRPIERFSKSSSFHSIFNRLAEVFLNPLVRLLDLCSCSRSFVAVDCNPNRAIFSSGCSARAFVHISIVIIPTNYGSLFELFCIPQRTSYLRGGQCVAQNSWKTQCNVRSLCRAL